MPKVVYITGAPAAGKSSTVQMLAQRSPGLLVWEYGARLTEHIDSKVEGRIEQDALRERSSGLVTVEDVAEVDRALLKFVQEHRHDSNVLIDSHPVTKERYGFRITAFSLQQIAALSPNEIWVLYASPDETRRRIKVDPAGRPMVTHDEAHMHTIMQASVATTYGMAAGCPVYMFDTAEAREELLAKLLGRLP